MPDPKRHSFRRVILTGLVPLAVACASDSSGGSTGGAAAAGAGGNAAGQGGAQPSGGSAGTAAAGAGAGGAAACGEYGDWCLEGACCAGLICDGESSTCISTGATLGPDEICTGAAESCAVGLVCCYPCGIEGCDYVCTWPCDETEPACVNGCMMMP